MSLSKLNHQPNHQQQCPPPPELPEFCLLALFSQMSLLDRIYAHQVCPQSYHRVREVNQSTVRTVTIVASVTESLNQVIGEEAPAEEFLNNRWDVFGSSYSTILPLVRLVTTTTTSPADHGQQEPSAGVFPLRRHRLTVWNCLHFFAAAADDQSQMNAACVRPLISTLPQLAELVFVYGIADGRALRCLVEMLQAEGGGGKERGRRKWRAADHLTRLTVANRGPAELGVGDEADNDEAILGALFAAINGLPALQYLSLRRLPLLPPELPILARLKEISIENSARFSDKLLTAFVRSLQQYITTATTTTTTTTTTSGSAALEPELRVDLFASFSTSAENQEAVSRLHQLGEPLRRCFTCLSDGALSAYDYQLLHSLRLTAFPNLTSLNVFLFAGNLIAVFAVLAQLPHLTTLSLAVTWRGVPLEELPQPPPLPRVRLPSVRWLELSLFTTAHSQLQWLNLRETVPGVQLISLEVFICEVCHYEQFWDSSTSLASRSCLRVQLQVLMDCTGFPAQRITCCHHGQQVPAEKLLEEE
mgnify:CR=1 FL=1